VFKKYKVFHLLKFFVLFGDTHTQTHTKKQTRKETKPKKPKQISFKITRYSAYEMYPKFIRWLETPRVCTVTHYLFIAL